MPRPQKFRAGINADVLLVGASPQRHVRLPVFAGKKEKIMPQQAHNKAAEHHETAAKSHRQAAEQHGKNDHAKGKEHATQAQQHAQMADTHSKTASEKSAQQR
jgi:hypothetical protein